MSETETETPAKARKWNAFVCPGCRFLFRVPMDHDGRGVVCACCRRLLRLPQAGDDVPVLVEADLPAGAVGDSSGQSGPGPSDARRQDPDHPRPRLPVWRALWNGVFGAGDESHSLWAVLVVGMLVAFLGVFGMIRLVSGAGKGAGDSGGGEVEAAAPVTVHDLLDLPPGGTGDPPVEEPAVIEPAAFVLKAEPLARRLVDAKSVDEMLPLVRDPERNGPLMRDWYARNGLDGLGILGLAPDGEMTFRGRIASVPLRMSDFTNREMAFVLEDDRLLIDWPSWVAWSEMEWPAFMDRRPTEAKLFRVLAQRGNYFNFGFSEDGLWRCYEIESPDRGHLLYGYGKIGSDADNRLAGVEKERRRALTLRLRYPEDAKAGNQVIIEEVVAEGWVVLEDGEGESR